MDGVLRADGLTGNPIFLGVASNLYIFLSLYLLAGIKKGTNLKVYIVKVASLAISALLFVYMLFLSGSRGPFLAFLVGIFS